MALRQADLFSQVTICDYLFDKDKIFAYLNLDDNELFIYQRLYELLARDVAAPDLVLYLQAPTDVLRRRLTRRRTDPELAAFDLDPDYLRELNEAYHHFFFHYDATPLLVVETSELDANASEEAIEDLVKQIRTPARAPATTCRGRSSKLNAHGVVQEDEQANGGQGRRPRPAACPRACGPSVPAARSSSITRTWPRT